VTDPGKPSVLQGVVKNMAADNDFRKCGMEHKALNLIGMRKLGREKR
jgi:hypothetical protein